MKSAKASNSNCPFSVCLTFAAAGFARFVGSVYAYALLLVFMRIQLAILGGIMLRWVTKVGEMLGWVAKVGEMLGWVAKVGEMLGWVAKVGEMLGWVAKVGKC